MRRRLSRACGIFGKTGCYDNSRPASNEMRMMPSDVALSCRIRTLPVVALAAMLTACTSGESGTYQGYAEGEYVRVAAPFAGNLTKLAVARGGQVKPGDALFVLEQENEAAARREADERLKNAESQLANL